ncbi:MAG: hypothetical protein ACLFVJ_19500, partial [Persicimonas sp.]
MARQAVIFANVGTSIIGNFIRRAPSDEVDELSANLDDVNDQITDAHELEASGHDTPGAVLVDPLVEWARKEGSSASAELNSTLKIVDDLGTNEKPVIIHLFATDTVDGMVSARAVRTVLEATFTTSSISVHRVGGLQVDDGSTFTRFGLPTYVEEIYKWLRRSPPASFRRIFNPTGGFKSVVPYLTLIAMLEGAETRYIYERSEDLLELRPLPISFDESLIERALPVLDATVANGSAERRFIEQELDLSEPLYRSRFASLWTRIDGEDYIVSGLGEILRQRSAERTDPVYLSSKARQDLDSLDPDKRGDLLQGLLRLRSPDLRSSSQHGRYRTEKSDCACLGRQKHPYRIHFVEYRGDADIEVRVVRLFHISDHDERDRVLDSTG